MRTLFDKSVKGRMAVVPAMPKKHAEDMLPHNLLRAKPAKLPELSELDVVRHFTQNSHKNFSVDGNFYPLGSCTMKYNAKVIEHVAGLAGFSKLHPLIAQLNHGEQYTQGALQAVYEIEQYLCEINGMKAFTMQPMSGANGEFTGVMLIAAYHKDKGNKKTKIVVPDSAHGTNPASAMMAGYEIVNIPSKDGMIDPDVLEAALTDDVAALMMTCPNTLGLFERHLPKIVEKLRKIDALLYYDGANLNAIMGKMRVGDVGFDVVHLNLHKTMGTPHGGGGPGAGPVGVRKGLEPFFPTVSPYHGNFAVAMRAYAYILSLGKENIKMVGPLATLNANYIKEALKDIYELPIDGLCKHEFVFNGLKDKSTGVTTMDVAKRLLDYGYHAPTIYFPLLFHESLMIEPAENESKETMDGFIEVMRRIAEEAKTEPDTVKNAPHNTPIGRVDDVLAAKHPIVTYRQMCNDKQEQLP